MIQEPQQNDSSSLVIKREGNSPTNQSSTSLTSIESENKITKVQPTANQPQSIAKPEFSAYENIWKFTFIFTLVIGAVLVHKVYLFHNDSSTLHIPKGSIYDFWVSIIVALAIGVIRSIIKGSLQKKLVGFLSEKRASTYEDGMKRADQICKWIFDLFYYSSASICAYLIVKDQPFLPPTLLGNGQCSKLFMEYPNVPEIPYLKMFYLIQAGAHLNALVHQLVAKRSDPKFYEFALHHVLAMFLVWFSYMMNFLLVGVVVLILHDPGDVMLILTRMYTDLKNKRISINIALFLMSYPTWIYTRNLVFPSCVIKSCLEFFLAFNFDEYKSEIFYLPFIYMLSMLGVLALMHVYWTFFFSKAIVSMISKGKDKNGYDS